MRVDRAKFAAAVATADLKLGELAERTGVSRATITAVKCGKSCAEETAKKLAAGLGVTVSELCSQA